MAEGQEKRPFSYFASEVMLRKMMSKARNIFNFRSKTKNFRRKNMKFQRNEKQNR